MFSAIIMSAGRSGYLSNLAFNPFAMTGMIYGTATLPTDVQIIAASAIASASFAVSSK